MRKRMLSMLLVLILVLGMVPVSAQAAEIIASDEWCPGIICTRYADGTLEFTGSGILTGTEKFLPDMYNATCLVIGSGITAIDESFNAHSPNVVSIEIEDTVQSIGGGVFAGCPMLTKVKLGNSMKAIGARCFQDCTNLTDIDLGTSLETIGEMAFYGTGIQQITIPASVTTIEERAFSGSALKTVTVPQGVTQFGTLVFENCRQLTNATVASSVVPEQAFQGCSNLTNVTLENTVTKIEPFAFSKSGLTSVTIPGSVTGIGERAFGECGALKTVTIEDGVKVIGKEAFVLCTSLESIELPQSVTTVQDSAFSSCESLKKVTLANANTALADNAFAACHEDLVLNRGGNVGIQCYGKYSENINWTYYYDGRMVFSGTGEINRENSTFRNVLDRPWQDQPIKIIIEDGITAIGEMALSFGGLTQVVSIEIAGSVKTIGASAFGVTENLKELTLHEGIEVIGTGAFSRTALESVVIPDSVHTLENTAFYACESMTEAYIGEGLKKQGVSVFQGNPMEIIVYKGDAPECEPGDLGTCEFPPVICYNRNNPTWTDEYIQSHVHYTCDTVNFAGCDVNEAGDLIPHIPTQEEVRQSILALQPEYPEGMAWGSEKVYVWDANGCIGEACSAFAMEISDRVFGATPATEVYLQIKLEDLHAGDILCYRTSPTTTHAVVILEVHADHVVIVEGNYDGKVHWGRTMTREEVESAYCYYSRYFVRPDYSMLTVSDDNSNAEGPTFTTNAAVVARDDYEYDTLDWVYYDDGTVVISGTGTIPDHYYWTTPWQEAKKVVIMSGITEIDDSAFRNMKTIESVHIAGTVNMIGESAFADNGSLKEIVLYEGIKYIDDHAFYYSMAEGQSIKLVIPDSVVCIGETAFRGCKSLTEIVLGKGLRKLEPYVFVNCCLRKITFRGDAPEFGLTVFFTSGCFDAGTVEIYYPLDNPTWTQRFMQAHATHLTGTNIKWIGLGESASKFTDVPADKFYATPVAWAVEKGITNGVTETEFRPDQECTRGQVMTFIWRANGCPEPRSMNHNFTDLDPNKFYYKAVIWAVEQGITTGKTATTFEPNATCTRSQVVTFLWRAAGEPAAPSVGGFPDVNQDAYYYDAVLWAVGNGITNGFKDGTFGPRKDCNRGQIVTFLYRDMVQ